MDDGDGGIVILILQILKKRPQLPHQEHPFIDDGPAGEGDHIGIVVALFKYPAYNVKLPVKLQALFHSFRLFHKGLPDGRHTFPGFMPQHHGIRGHFPPSQEIQPFLLGNDFKHFLCLACKQFVRREKEHTDPVFPLPAKVDPGHGAGLPEETMGNLGQDSHAVPCFAFRIFSRAMLQMLHNLKRIRHDPVAFFPMDAGHRADPAVIVFKLRAVKPL